MARRRLEGLERVLGVNALFSTAYGNVGSSIYYALGLVAALALGLTPIVFLITGIFFLCTAATYAEATAMYPEAGGSSSFARRAFNEFWSFFAAWGQMLNYVVTVAISAFFVPHYLGSVFWEELRHSPADIIAGAIIIAILAVINVFGAKESAGLNIALAVVDFLTQVLLVIVGAVLVLGANPGQLAENVVLGVAPTWKDFILAIPIGMIAYTGIETISNMAEEARDEIKTIPAAIKRVAIAVFAIYFTLPAVALVALPVQQGADGEYYTLLGLSEEEGGYAGDPIAGLVANLNLGAFQTAAEIYVGILAATILFLATNAGLIGVSRLVYSMGIHRQLPDQLRRLHPRYRTPWIGIIVFAVAAIIITLPGQAEFLGYLYAFGAMLSFTIAHLALIRLRISRPEIPRPYRSPGNVNWRGKDIPVFAVVGGLGHRGGVRRHRRAASGRGRHRRRLAGARRRRLPALPARAGARPGLDAQGRDPAAGRRSRGRVRLRAGAAGRRPLRRVGGGHRGQAGGPAAARDPRDRAGHGAERAEDRRADARGRGGRGVADRAGARAGRRARVRARRARALRPGRAADHRGGDRHAGGGDRDAAAAAGQRRVAVRQDARDRARGTALPRDHRVPAGERAPAEDAGVIRGYVLPAAMVLIGIALIVRTLIAEVDANSIGLILGVLFIAAGAGRIYVERKL